jgi:hypothetical protein
MNEQEPDKLVTVATFRDIFEADFVTTIFDLEGIPSILANQHVAILRWDYSNAIGGIRLNVLGKDAERARQLLRDRPIRPDSARPPVIDRDYDLACPECGSLEVRYERFSRFAFFLSWLVLGIPIPIPRRRFKCRTCRHGWKAQLTPALQEKTNETP